MHREASVPNMPGVLLLALRQAAPPADDEDARLVERARRHLPHFGELYQRHVQPVYRYLLVRVGNEADAQDLTSQTFMAAMENLDQYRGTQPFRAWLLGIGRNKTADFYRRRKPLAPLDRALNQSDPAEVSPDDSVAHRLQIEQVARKLQALAPDRSEAVALRLFGGLPTGEIAELMDRREAAVRMLIHRGLRDLQAQLDPQQREERR